MLGNAVSSLDMRGQWHIVHLRSARVKRKLYLRLGMVINPNPLSFLTPLVTARISGAMRKFDFGSCQSYSPRFALPGASARSSLTHA